MRYLIFILMVLVGCTSPDYEEQSVIDSLQNVGPWHNQEVQMEHFAVFLFEEEVSIVKDPEHNVPIVCGREEGQCGVDNCRCKCHGNIH